MEVFNSPDIFQEKISKLFDGFDMFHANNDGVLVNLKNNLEYHLQSLDRVLQRLAEAGIKVNAKNIPFNEQKWNTLFSC